MTNSRLKELMAIDPEELTLELQNELFDEIKNSSFFIPIIIDSENLNQEDNQITSDVPISFEFFTINHDDHVLLPLFTDENALEQIEGFNVIRYNAGDIAELIVDNGDISEIVINPNTETSIGIPKENFVYKCLEDEIKNFFDIEQDIKEYAVPLQNDTVFYLRTETPFMEDNAVDGIFTADVPLKVSSRDVYHREYPYLNKLVAPKGAWFLYLGNIIDNMATQSDVILAPIIKFKLEEKQDDNTLVWQCIEQDFKQD